MGTADVVESMSFAPLQVLIYEGQPDANGCQNFFNVTTMADGSAHFREYKNCTNSDSGVSTVSPIVTAPWYSLEDQWNEF